MTTARATRIERDFKKLSNNGLTRIWRPIRSIADGTIGAASCQRCACGAEIGPREAREQAGAPKCYHQPYLLRSVPRCCTLRQCLADERGARSQLERQWAQFPPALRQRCLATTETGGNPSYVEVLVCLQMGQDAAQLDEPSSGRK
jgi:hypothetical protein